MQKSVIFIKTIENKYLKDKKYRKIEIIAIIHENIGVLCTAYATYNSLLKRIAIVFHNGSTNDYHFIKKTINRRNKKQFTCLGKNTEKY